MRDGVSAGEFAETAMTDSLDAIHPRQHIRRALQNVGQRFDTAHEPQWVIHRKIGETGRVREQIRSILQHSVNAL